MDLTSVRVRSLKYLNDKGFHPARWLPVIREITAFQLRPQQEIAARLMALDCLFTWVSFSETDADSRGVERYRDRNRLTEWLTTNENAILSTERSKAHEMHVDTIGWKLENMWTLAWVLGFDRTPDVDTGMIQGETIRAIIMEFLPGLSASVDDLCAKATLRTLEQVVEMEDRFYCAHNAVRSAQRGGQTVPHGFYPIRDGGVVHERRHALTWCLSPGVTWDETALST